MSGVLFLATARSGLGHVRRLANIARHMAGRGISLELALNDDPAGLEPDERGLFDAIHRCERNDMARLAADRAARLVVADTLELPSLAEFDGRRALVLRETPRDRQGQFRLADDVPWDMVIVPNPADHWQPCAARVGSRAIESVGWIYRCSVESPRAERPRVLIATGGGGKQTTVAAMNEIVWPWLAGLVRRLADTVEFRQALGPRSDKALRLPPPVMSIDVGAKLSDAFAAADLVISTAGYNSVLELATCTTPAVLFPIDRSFDDQSARARLWGTLVGQCFQPLNEPRLTDWCRSVLAERRRRPAVDLGMSGAGRAAELLLPLAA